MDLVFEYDKTKSESNKIKHGIDFEEAQMLWADDDLVMFPAKRQIGEDRWAAIAVASEKHWSAFFTLRGGAIRLISVRRSRKSEVKFYESQKSR